MVIQKLPSTSRIACDVEGCKAWAKIDTTHGYACSPQHAQELQNDYEADVWHQAHHDAK